MSTNSKTRFTGRHMTAVLVIGFGIVAAVNFFMASLAVGGFHGVVVENSYVASQHYNDWLEKAAASKALGWSAQASRTEDGYVVVTTQDVPQAAKIHAELRRPLGDHELASLSFTRVADGQYRSDRTVHEGRWTMRLFIEADGQVWAEESELR